jgi:hypothetical protein
VVSFSKEVLNFHINFSFIHILWAIALSPRPLGPWVITTLENACEFKIWLSYLITTLAASTRVLLFSEMLKFLECFFWNNLFRKELLNFFFRRQLLNFQEYSIYQKDSKLIDYLRIMCLRCQSTMVDIIANCKVGGSKVINWIVFSFNFFIMMYHT